MKVGDTFIGGPPNDKDLRSLSKAGVKTVIDFREAGEDDGQGSARAAAHGLSYVNIRVSKDSLSDAKVEEFRRALKEKPGPVLLHCSSGARAGAMMLMSHAVDNNLTSHQALDMANQLGFDCDAHPEIKAFFVGYIDRHSRPGSI